MKYPWLEDALFIDTETTRAKATADKPVEVVEMAWNYGDSEEVTTIRYRPLHGMSWGALAIHNILPSELEVFPTSDEAQGDSPTKTDTWIGHNVDFDWQALGSPPKVRRIDTLALARWLWPTLDSHSLAACYYFLFGATPTTREKLRSAHSAAADVLLCHDLLLGMLDLLTRSGLCPTSLDGLWELSEKARIPTVFTFGKFKDQPIRAADRGYAQWCKRQPDMDPYLIKAFELAGLL